MKKILALLLVFSILVPDVAVFASTGMLYAMKKQPQITTPDGKTISYKYDSGNRLTEIRTDCGSFKFTYDIAGRRIKLLYPSGVNTTYSYDSSGRLTSTAHMASNGTVIESFSYTYDNVGNVLSKTSLDTEYGYTYDAIYKLIQAVPKKLESKNKEQTNKSEIFTYDPVGNRLTGPYENDSYLYNSANQLTSDSRYKFEYDKNGNLREKKTIDGSMVWAYEYDYENRLNRVVKQDAGAVKTITFKYDPLGKRIERDVEEKGAIKTYKYFYGDEDIIFEELTKSDYYGTRTETTTYIHGPGIDEPLAVIQNGEVYYYHADGSSSIIALTDSRGRVVQRYEYDSFGNVSQYGDKVKQSYAYIGREWDKETGLYYLRARYYDAEIGRYITKDPSLSLSGDPNTPYLLQQQLKNPQELNGYTYAHNNPVTYNDPTGLFAPAVAIGYCLSNLPACAGAILTGGALLIEILKKYPIPEICGNKNDKNGCALLYENDLSTCRKLKNADARSRCYASAMERKIACETNKPLPPLVKW